MYTFNSKSRHHLVRDYTTLSSPVVHWIIAVSALAALASLLAYAFVAAANPVLGLLVLSLSVCAGASLVEVYSATYYPHVPPRLTVSALAARKDDVNIAAAASFDLIKAIGPAGVNPDAASLKQAAGRLVRDTDTNHLFYRLGLNREAIRQAIEQTVVPALTWEEFARQMLETARSLKQEVIMPEHALGALLLQPAMQTVLRAHGLTDSDVRFGLWWGAERRAGLLAQRRWWAEEQLLAFSGIGLSWASGYTPFVDRFARLPRGNFWDNVIHGHEVELDSLINSLARQRQSNVLLVGDPGVGTLGIIRRLSTLMRTNRAHPALNGDRLLYMNIGELMAIGGAGSSGLGNVSRALAEMERSGNITVILDGLSSVLGQAGEGRANLTDILVPFLSSRTVRVVVVISLAEYHLRMKPNDELMQYFEVVLVPSLSPEATMKRIALSLPSIERAAGVYIPYQTMRTLVKDTTSISPHIPFPERAFDFLEEAIVLAQREGERVLQPRHVHTVISHKIGVNLGELQAGEKKKLLGLEDLMHQRLVNQQAAVKAVVHAMVRARAEVRSTTRPIGTFLFLGPTGVGKTETAKTLAEVYFGSEEHMVRLDMSEFQGPDAAARLIGSSYQPIGRLTSLIADHPFTVLLLDEFEKADEMALQLFLPVFDEGHLTDSTGRRYSFENTIIIATSNAGAELIREQVKDGVVPAGFDEELKEFILRNNVMRPELLNRFDAVITYTPLNPEHIREIAGLMLRSLNKRLDAQHGITVALTDELIDFLVEVGYEPEFGARPMARAIQDTVEYAVAQQVLTGGFKPGDQITLPAGQLRSLIANP